MGRLMSLLLLGSLLVVNERGDQIARMQERHGSIDVFDAHSNRLGWGRVNRGGDVELFDTRGNRIGTWRRNRGVIRLERK